MNSTIFSNPLHKSFTRLLLTVICGILLIPICSNAQSYISQAGTDATLHQYALYRIHASTSHRDFTIPTSTNGKYIYLEAHGADGGCIFFKNKEHVGNGGQGATVKGYFKIGPGKNEIPVGSTLRTVIGYAGGSYTNHGQTYHHSAGGGGGTGVLFLPAGINTTDARPEDWVILMVAGGGGGGYAKWGGRVVDGYPGSDQEDVTGTDNQNYIANDPEYDTCVSFTGKYTGWGGRSGGGVGYQLLRDVCDQIPESNTKPIGDSSGSDDTYADYTGGFGGFQMSNGKMQPIGYKGGSGSKNPGGGFGFGSGGGGSTNEPGGGGGYTGGRSGNTSTSSTPAGGGGSFINTNYAQNSTAHIIKNGIVNASSGGFVHYRVFSKKHIRYAADLTKALDIFQASTADGANIQLWTSHNDYTNQQWVFSGSTIRSVRDLGKCLDVNTGNTANGTNIQLWHCNNGSAQDWVIQGQTIRLMKDQTKCLNLKQNNTAPGTNIQLWDCNGTAAQNWAIE